MTKDVRKVFTLDAFLQNTKRNIENAKLSKDSLQAKMRVMELLDSVMDVFGEFLYSGNDWAYLVQGNELKDSGVKEFTTYSGVTRSFDWIDVMTEPVETAVIYDRLPFYAKMYKWIDETIINDAFIRNMVKPQALIDLEARVKADNYLEEIKGDLKELDEKIAHKKAHPEPDEADLMEFLRMISGGEIDGDLCNDCPNKADCDEYQAKQDKEAKPLGQA